VCACVLNDFDGNHLLVKFPIFLGLFVSFVQSSFGAFKLKSDSEAGSIRTGSLFEKNKPKLDVPSTPPATGFDLLFNEMFSFVHSIQKSFCLQWFGVVGLA